MNMKSHEHERHVLNFGLLELPEGVNYIENNEIIFETMERLSLLKATGTKRSNTSLPFVNKHVL